VVPKLWNETIDAHRHAVRKAILDTTWALATEHGLTSVTMSQIAEKTGIGRATLYKYFPDVEAILLAWHERQVAAHLQQLADIRDDAGDAGQRLDAVLEAYAFIPTSASATARNSALSCMAAGTPPTRSSTFKASSETCSPRPRRPARSGMTSRPTSLPAIASTP
jgi:AcrR family transcriptional regulator